MSKNLISCNGSITDRLKKDWGVNDVWNVIILPRFQRLNELTNSKNFTTLNAEGHEIPAMPFELQKGFNKKRIDHRHHAMDAIVIACTTRSHVNLLNNEAAMSKNRQNYYALSNKLRRVEKVVVKGKEQNVFKEFIKPWPTFNADVLLTLQNIIVSIKQNLRVINKTVNYYQHYKDGKKVMVLQDKGESWTIRKPLHKATVFGEVNLMLVKEVSLKEALKQPTRIVDKELKQKVKELMGFGKDAKAILKYFADNKDIWPETANGKIEVYYYTKETKDRYFATRFLSDLVGYFAKITKPEDAIKKIEAITDMGIRKILKAHLQAKGNDPTLAFSADGIDEMNENIVVLNGGKQHKPIYKMRRYEKADKYAIGVTGNNPMKFVEAATGTNLFFAVYEFTNEGGEKKRSFVTVPLNLVIDCQKQYKTEWKSKLDIVLKEKELANVDADLLFVLSPNDLVYVPNIGEDVSAFSLDHDRIYKMVSASGPQCFFVRNIVSSPIINKFEFSPLNKMERALTGEMIKEICLPIKVDRLGNIVEINGKKIND